MIANMQKEQRIIIVWLVKSRQYRQEDDSYPAWVREYS